jgi:hypothetical protein
MRGNQGDRRLGAMSVWQLMFMKLVVPALCELVAGLALCYAWRGDEHGSGLPPLPTLRERLDESLARGDISLTDYRRLRYGVGFRYPRRGGSASPSTVPDTIRPPALRAVRGSDARSASRPPKPGRSR